MQQQGTKKTKQYKKPDPEKTFKSSEIAADCYCTRTTNGTRDRYFELRKAWRAESTGRLQTVTRFEPGDEHHLISVIKQASSFIASGSAVPEHLEDGRGDARIDLTDIHSS